MSDHITDPHASGSDHGLTRGHHSPLAKGETPEPTRDTSMDRLWREVPTDEASIRAAYREAIKGAPLMSIPVRPTDGDLVLKKAIDELIVGRSTIATLTARAEAAEAVAERWRAQTEQARAELERVTGERDEARAELTLKIDDIASWEIWHGDRVRENAAIAAERDALQHFKDYCHKRLDEAGIEADPESPHREAGCRIGGRFDVLIGQRDGAQADIRDMARAMGLPPDARADEIIGEAEALYTIRSERDALRAELDGLDAMAGENRKAFHSLLADSSRLRAAVEEARAYLLLVAEPCCLVRSALARLTAALSPAPGEEHETAKRERARANRPACPSLMHGDDPLCACRDLEERALARGRKHLEDVRREERERAAHIAETHPLHPSTRTGERQRWLREGIAKAIRGEVRPLPKAMAITTPCPPVPAREPDHRPTPPNEFPDEMLSPAPGERMWDGFRYVEAPTPPEEARGEACLVPCECGCGCDEEIDFEGRCSKCVDMCSTDDPAPEKASEP